MTVNTNRRSVMTLFSAATDIFSHNVRVVLAEKGVNVEIEQIDIEQPPEDLTTLNPYGTVPTLVDRELTLYKSSIIIEYLDERFPHPPLMPVYPVARGNSRLLMHRIEHDWYSLVKTIERGSGGVKAAREQLREQLLATAPIFIQYQYFMSDEFTLVDCAMIPLLWRLPALGIRLTGSESEPLIRYMKRLFERESFALSLSEVEREMGDGVKI